jgi:hypothetical protein
MTLILCKYVKYAYTFALRLIMQIEYKKQREIPCTEIILIIFIVILQPFVGSRPFFQFLNPIHNR